MSRDLAALIDIREATTLAQNLASGLDEAGFGSDPKAGWAVWSQIVIIGEAANRVSVAFQESNPHLPWSEMIGMRHRLVHGYDSIDWSRGWQTLVKDLPALRRQIDGAIAAQPSSQEPAESSD